MSKFKVGDEVVRTRDESFGMRVGDVAKVVGVDVGGEFQPDHYQLTDYYGWHSESSLELVEPEEVLPELTSALHFTEDDGSTRLRVHVSEPSNRVYFQSATRESGYGFHTHSHYMTPDDALQLASDLRRVAMAAKRRQKLNDTL